MGVRLFLSPWIRDVFCAQNLRVLGCKTQRKSRLLGDILKQGRRWCDALELAVEGGHAFEHGQADASGGDGADRHAFDVVWVGAAAGQATAQHTHP